MTKPKRQQHQTIPPGAKCIWCAAPATVWKGGGQSFKFEFDYYACKDCAHLPPSPMVHIFDRPVVAR